MTMQTTAQRLAAARASAAKFKTSHPDWVAHHDWRTLVARPFKRKYAVIRRSEDGRKLYADSFDALGWRFVGVAHEIAPSAVRHCGWFADHHREVLIIGAVVQLPAVDGNPQYYAATYCDEWDGITVYLDHRSNEPEDCAYWADQCAEREAEESREAYAKDQAEQDILQARDEIHSLNREALVLIREIKAAGVQSSPFSPAICAALRDRLADYMDERRRQFAIIAARQSDYRTAVGGY